MSTQAPPDSDLGFPAKGSLKRVPFAFLVRDIARTHATGNLYLLAGETKKVVFFVDGRPTLVRSNLATEFLGQILTDQGLITQEQCDNTLEAIRRTGKKQGELLVEMGILSEGNLRYGLEEQVRIKLFEIFGWEEGRFQFKQSGEPGMASTGFTIELPAEALIIAGVQERWTDERARAALKALADRYPAVAAPYTGDAVNLELLPEEQYFLRCLDGSRTVDELLNRKYDPEVPQISTLLFGLIASGVVDAGETKQARRLPPPRPNLSAPNVGDDKLSPKFEQLSAITEYEDTPLPNKLPGGAGISSSRNPRIPILPTEDEEMFRGLDIDESIVTDSRALMRSVEAARRTIPIVPEPRPLDDETDFGDLGGDDDGETDFSELVHTHRPGRGPAPTPAPPARDDPGKSVLPQPPLGDSSKSPLPRADSSKSPAPRADSSKSPAPRSDSSKSPAPRSDSSKSPRPAEPPVEAPAPGLGQAPTPTLAASPRLGAGPLRLTPAPSLGQPAPTPAPTPIAEPEPPAELPDLDADGELPDLGDLGDLGDLDDIGDLGDIDGDLEVLDDEAMFDDPLGDDPLGDDPLGDDGPLPGDSLPASSLADLEPLDGFAAQGEDADLLGDSALIDASGVLATGDGESSGVEELPDLDDEDLPGDDPLAGDEEIGDLDEDLEIEDVELDAVDEEELEDGEGFGEEEPEDGYRSSSEDTDRGRYQVGPGAETAELLGATRYGQAEDAMREGDYDTAVALFEDAYANGYDVAELHAHLAFARYRASNNDPTAGTHALELLDWAEQADPGFPMIHAYRGAIFVGLGRQEEADECFDRALYLDPENELALAYTRGE